MKDTLKQFTTEDLREASFCLLNKLGLKYNKASRTPITLDSLYNEKLTEQESLVYGHVKKAYFVAALNQNSFTNPNLDAALNVETDNVEKDDKYSSMLVFALEVDADGKLFKMTRTNCAVLTRLFNKISNSLPVVLFIKQNDKLHISTCERSSYKRNHYNGEKLGKVSMLMGINCANAHTGHCRILEKLMVSPSVHGFDDLYRHWLDKFNTKTLTEDFYTDLYKWFMWVVYDDNAKFPENSHLSKAENEEKNTKVIRLITRLMFVWFLKEKRLKKKEGETSGTAVGSETAAISALRVKEGETSGLVPDCIFDADKLKDILADFDANSATEGNYYNAILQNLFFATLNNEVEARRFVDTPFQGRSKGYMVKVLFRDNKKKSWFRISHDEVLRIFEKVPYLNCGLFECLDKYKRTDISYDKDRIFDGFSTRDDSNYRTCLPNRLFFADELPEKRIEIEAGREINIEKTKGIVKIFEDYVFTVEENTPMDQQVSLDPELLGKVFENLLAAYNPETSSEARKSSGSFYTPREIVEYMVTESLIQYLKTSLNDEVEEEQLRNLVSSEEKGFKLNEGQTEKILEALYQCKVLDPACGSGAFPMGMLQQMVHVIERLDEKNEKWKEIITKIAKNSSAKAYENDSIQDEERKERVDEIHRIFTYSKNNPCYARKLFLIQNCLFGVDIQPIAMMISKLRFFISLICEQDEDSVDFDDKKNNYCINTLPNLETKFVAANSLLTADIHKFSGDWTNDQHLEQLKDELMELRRLHFSAKSQSEKLKIRTRDEQKRMEIIDYILSTQAHADQEKISLLQDQINHLAAERKAYEGEKIVDEYCDAQTSLFDAPQPTLFHRDVNKAKREEIDRQILRCQAEITREQSKENIVGFEAAVKQITDWNPYDQIKASPFFDPDWMFGVKVDADSGVGFDIVIGNPPYVVTPANHPYQFYQTSKCNELYAFFFELAINLLHNNGILSYITASLYVKGIKFDPLRLFLQNKSSLIEYRSQGDDVFKNVKMPTSTFIAAKGEGRWSFIELNPDFLIISKIASNNKSLCDISDSNRGLEIGKDKILDKGPIKCIKAVEKYIPRKIGYISKEVLNAYHKDERYFTEERLLLRESGSFLTAIYMNYHIYSNRSLYSFIIKDKMYNPKYVLACINSKLLQFYYSNVFRTDTDLFPKIRKEQAELLPISKADDSIQNVICKLIDNIIEEKSANADADISQFEKEIDILVYLLYGLTYAEVEIVDQKFSIEKYTQWIANYQKDGTLPTETEMKEALGVNGTR